MNKQKTHKKNEALKKQLANLENELGIKAPDVVDESATEKPIVASTKPIETQTTAGIKRKTLPPIANAKPNRNLHPAKRQCTKNNMNTNEDPLLVSLNDKKVKASNAPKIDLMKNATIIMDTNWTHTNMKTIPPFPSANGNQSNQSDIITIDD